MVKNRLLTFFMCFFIIVLIISFSVGLPIYFRGFYYSQIESLGITKASGLENSKIIEAYDDILDYLTLKDSEFSAGEIKFTPSCESHFTDCRVLFTINFIAFFISAAVIIFLLILNKKRHFKFSKPFNLHFTFICGFFIILTFLLIAEFFLIDFDFAFAFFHKILFLGKENWIFNRFEDPIITILPKKFFVNCGIFIICSITLLSLCLMVFGFIKSNREIK